jgi:hypothetical protein
MKKDWHIIFKKVDPATGDTHRLYEKFVVIKETEKGRLKEKISRFYYAYTCHDKLGKQKALLTLSSQDSARNHFIKKSGSDPFEEVVVSD